MMGMVLRYLGSVRFTLLLILSLAVLFLLGLWIPQKSVIQRNLYLQWQVKSPDIVALLDTFQLTSIYTAPITLVLWSFFFLNLALVMWQRMPIVWKKTALQPDGSGNPLAMSGYSHTATVSLPPTAGIEQMEPLLRKAGYRTAWTRDRLTAVKNRFSPLATLLFHLSFFLMLLGGVISLYTRFSATVDLAEGEVFQGELMQYNQPLSLPKIGSLPRTAFVVESIRPETLNGTHTGIGVTISDASGNKHVAEINRPYKTDHTSFVIRSLGVAPLIILADDLHRELDGAYVKLNVLQGKRDAFVLETLRFDVEFFPDYVERYGVYGTRSEEIRNPAFLFDIWKGSQSLGRTVVKVGESVRLNGYRLEIREMPFWVRLYVVRERGLSILYLGFSIAICALVWRLVYYRRDISGMILHQEGDRLLQLQGKSEFFPFLFADEFQRLTAAFRSVSDGS